MAVESQILFDEQTTPDILRNALSSFARVRGASLSPGEPHPSVFVASGLYMMAEAHADARSMYADEFGIDVGMVVYARANKMPEDFLLLFNIDCLDVVASVVVLVPSFTIVMLRNWENVVLDKRGDRIDIIGLEPKRCDRFIKATPPSMKVELRNEEEPRS